MNRLPITDDDNRGSEALGWIILALPFVILGWIGLATLF